MLCIFSLTSVLFLYLEGIANTAEEMSGQFDQIQMLTVNPLELTTCNAQPVYGPESFKLQKLLQ
jgi:hypothetical protein